MGGDQEAFETCCRCLKPWVKNIRYEGKAGNGQHTKMCNQIAMPARSAALRSHCLRQGRGPGFQVMLDSISTGAAGSAQLSNVASRILKDDYGPGFFIKHFIKDMS